MRFKKYIFILGVLAIGNALCSVSIAAQDSTKTSLVYLEHSETLSFDEKRLPDAQILRGDVRFRHDSVLMFCDSAYFFEKDNSLHAFGHVHMIQGDTLEGFGDVLYYNGNTKMARLRKNVKLIHQQTTLTTDSLNYDRIHDIAYYFSGGVIQDSLNTLASQWGQYTPNNHQALFRSEVVLNNPKFVLTADTLGYNTESYQSDLIGPTTILYEEETDEYESVDLKDEPDDEEIIKKDFVLPGEIKIKDKVSINEISGLAFESVILDDNYSMELITHILKKCNKENLPIYEISPVYKDDMGFYKMDLIPKTQKL